MKTPILFGDHLETIKRKTTAPLTADLWNHLLSRWEGVAQRVAATGPFTQGALGYHSITPMVVEAAAIWHLTGRTDARDYALKLINHHLNHYAPQLENPQNTVKIFPHGNAEVALAADLLRNALPVDTRATLLRFMREIAIPMTTFEHALAGYSSGSNVSLGRNIDAAICALAWGEESNHENWQQVVNNTCDNVRQYLRNGCDELGFSYEGTGYGEQVMQFLFLFCHLLRQTRWPDDLLRDEPLLRLIPDSFIHMFLPGGRYCATTNDSGHRAPMSLWWLLLAAREWHRPDYYGAWHHYSHPNHPIRPWGDSWPQWAASAGTTPQMIEHVDKTLILTLFYWEPDAPSQPIQASPLPTAICATGSGTATFRTSWNPNALFASLLGGGRNNASLTHGHADCGHFNIAIGDEYLAVDTGRYNTNEDQHSVVLINGTNSYPSSSPGGGMAMDETTGALKDFQRHPILDYCVADATGTKDARWALRNFLFIRTGNEDGYIVMLDNINTDNGTSTHKYWWQLQCATTATIKITGPNSATVSGTDSRIDCSFFHKLTPSTPGEPHNITVTHDIKEWVWPYGYDQDPEVVSQFERTAEGITSIRRPRLLAIQETGSCVLLSLLSPRRGNEPIRQITQIPVTNGIGLTVDSGSFTDTILVAPDHKLILTDQLKCFSEFALIRRNPGGQILNIWTASGAPVQFF